MSAEKFARRSVLEVTACRIIGQGVYALSAPITALGKGIELMADAVFMLECDAARRYKAATGYDLGAAAGYPARYSDQPEEFAREGPEEDELDV